MARADAASVLARGRTRSRGAVTGKFFPEPEALHRVEPWFRRGVVAMASAITTLVSEAPSTAETTMASTIEGNAISAAMIRMIGWSRW